MRGEGTLIRRPRVTVGLPVYQGAQYIDEAIRAVRAQTYRDLELVISDNGSTDCTEAICRRHAAEDPRVSYYRSPVNRGASWNYNRLVELAQGEYFKWASHDDVIMPEFVERCVHFLDADPELVLCHTGAVTIDDHGLMGRRWPPNPNAMAGPPARRFADVALREGPCFPVFGLMRLDVLKRTGLLGPYNAHDRPLLAELALHGRFLYIPDILFLNRDHQQRSIRAFKGPRDRIAWFDPSQSGRIVFSDLRLLLEYHRAITRVLAPGWDSTRSELTLGWWTVLHARSIAREVLGGLRQLLRRAINAAIHPLGGRQSARTG